MSVDIEQRYIRLTQWSFLQNCKKKTFNPKLANSHCGFLATARNSFHVQIISFVTCVVCKLLIFVAPQLSLYEHIN